MSNINDLLEHKKLLNKMHDIITKLSFKKKGEKLMSTIGVNKKLY